MPAAVVAAGIGAAASVGGAMINKSATKKATNANVQAQQDSLAAQERMANENRALQMGIYNNAGQMQTDIYNQNVSTLNPFTQTGYSAMNARNAMLGLPQQKAYTPKAITFTPLTAAAPATSGTPAVPQVNPVAQNALMPAATNYPAGYVPTPYAQKMGY